MKRYRFNDFDAFANSVHGVDARMLSTNVTLHEWGIDQIDLGGVRLQVGSLGSGNVVEGQSWPNKAAIYLPLSPSIEYLANACRAAQYQFVIIEPNSDFCVSTQQPHDWAAIFVDIDTLTNTETWSPDASEALQFRERHCYVAARSWLNSRRFLTDVREVLLAASNSEHFETTPAGRRAEEELLELARTIVGAESVGGQPAKRKGRPAFSRRDLIYTCDDFYRGHSSARFSMQELAAFAGVSERTLRNAFYDYYGCGPSHYFRRRQLNDVHAALLEADPSEVNVSQLLSNRGIWEFGRFSKRYHDIYGELPSKTLRRTNGSS